ncbi:MAG: serine hydrolase domain-containing protein [Pseudoxanthomonas sp.]
MRLTVLLPALLATVLAWPLRAAPAVPAPVAPVGTSPALTRADLEAWLDGYMPYALDSGDVVGAVVVVVKDRQVLLEKGYGLADQAKRSPVDPQATLFRPGSVSKLFTWTAVMQQVEQGRIDLDADVNRYLDFKIPPRDGKPVTMRQLMTHTPGFEEQVRGLIATDPKATPPLDQALKRWVPERIYAPGGTPAYSNYGAALAGYIVERVSGEPFYDYLDHHIFAPLGMRRSSFRQPLPPQLLAHMSRGYASASDGKPKPYELIALAPAGSLAATGDDMARFMIAHLQDGAYGGARILQAATAEQMHTSGQASVGPLNRMMLGFYETTINGHRAIAHGGDTEWFHSDLQLFLDDGIGIFVSVNSAGRPGTNLQLRDALVRGFADRYLPPPATQPAGTVAAADARLHARQIAGSYVSSRRADSSFLSLLNPLGAVKVSGNEDGTISVSMALNAAGMPKKWREVSPYLWQDTASGDRLAAVVTDGVVGRFSMEPYAAIMVFDRLSGLHSPTLQLALLALSALALLTTVLAWPISALVRRRYHVPYGLSGADARAHRVIRIVALLELLTLGTAFALVLSMMSHLEFTQPSSDGLVDALRLVSTLVFPLGALLALWNAWQVLRSGRSRLAKLWSVVLALACLFLLVFALAHHLPGFGAYY